MHDYATTDYAMTDYKTNNYRTTKQLLYNTTTMHQWWLLYRERRCNKWQYTKQRCNESLGKEWWHNKQRHNECRCNERTTMQLNYAMNNDTIKLRNKRWCNKIMRWMTMQWHYAMNNNPIAWMITPCAMTTQLQSLSSLNANLLIIC